MASLSFRNVVKQYHQGKQSLQVIHGVNAEITDGEFIVIVGPSGCGKSTLLRMVAGLEEISGGEIRIGERVVNQLEPADRDIAMVFQNYALYPHMSVFENMAYGLKIKKLPATEIRQRVDKAAAILELGHLLDRKPRQLSGGQRQRVGDGQEELAEQEGGGGRRNQRHGQACVGMEHAQVGDDRVSRADADLHRQHQGDEDAPEEQHAEREPEIDNGEGREQRDRDLAHRDGDGHQQ